MVILSLFIVNCATVNLPESIPNYVSVARVIEGDLVVSTTFIHCFGIPEGDEFLESYRYIDPGQKHKIDTNHLRSLLLVIKVDNPRKKEYRLFTYSSSSKTKEECVLAYSGNLSRKEVQISLPAVKNADSEVHYEIRDKDNNIIFRGFTVQYKIYSSSGVSDGNNSP